MKKVALCQLQISHEPETNLKRTVSAIAEAASRGADLAIFPEATLTRFGSRIAGLAEPLDGPFVTGLAEAARDHGLPVIAGVFEPGDDPERPKVYNTAVAIDERGEVRAAYRKIHLFDAFTARESDLVIPGATPTVVELAGLRIGLITCYDVRFPELARALVDAGAEMFAVIAAWGSGPMKEDHWVTLVRARAIENTMWTAAVGQAPNPEVKDGFGVGRSMLVDPLGVVHGDLGPRAEVRVIELDPALTDEVRATLPCLDHRVI
ncbi:carbon-nitrogen hydrolase family protein [Spongiactinospora sp. TRM90649]|uniref:carbon-nitrogen hydrolase family protein n=1 Tax=Spongiactinospora sp. TRM90649 TaxID=3031114 RepID=UPI0023F7CA40|nr:carbon-nitrogen hydrolase family protein [Spongiactinospora sp. TRM90649]MDF5752398.1 carbon-nitrogen hydrolase family protein [Spongiactinospora sp. TRM90649]